MRVPGHCKNITRATFSNISNASWILITAENQTQRQQRHTHEHCCSLTITDPIHSPMPPQNKRLRLQIRLIFDRLAARTGAHGPHVCLVVEISVHYPGRLELSNTSALFTDSRLCSSDPPIPPKSFSPYELCPSTAASHRTAVSFRNLSKHCYIRPMRPTTVPLYRKSSKKGALSGEEGAVVSYIE